MIYRNSTTYKHTPKTFRRSSTKMINGAGVNMQNIEKEKRGIYHSDGFNPHNPALVEKCLFYLKTGDTDVFTEYELLTIRLLLQADQSGAEALIVAYDSKPADYRQLFIHNVKPHVYVAMKLFKEVWSKRLNTLSGFDIDTFDRTPIALLKQNPYWKDLDSIIKASDNWPISERYYYLAKQTCHSANYGIEAQTFRMNILEKSGGKIVISFKDAVKFLAIYRALFPEIVESNMRIAEQVERTAILYNMFGHPYCITDYKPDKMKEYYAWPRQSTVAEITRTAFCDLQEYIEAQHKSWDILGDCHDSYLAQCPLYEVKDCKKKMQEYLNIELTSPVDGVKFRMKSEVNGGFNWSPAKDFVAGVYQTNPTGLQDFNWVN